MGSKPILCCIQQLVNVNREAGEGHIKNENSRETNDIPDTSTHQ